MLHASFGYYTIKQSAPLYEKSFRTGIFPLRKRMLFRIEEFSVPVPGQRRGPVHDSFFVE